MLLLMKTVEEELARRGLQARDYLEIQSFLWVALNA